MDTLASEMLKVEQKRTLESKRRKYGFFARVLFAIMNLVYGRKRTLNKFKVLELIARVPYQAWESVAYVAITHVHSQEDMARRIHDRVTETRARQDNEQWHLLILEELTNKSGIREDFLRYRVLPQIIAFAYYHITWILYVIKPELSYRLNADFEDHAEHEYMKFVEENPELESTPFISSFCSDYGKFDSLADLFRQIGYDERVHKLDSLDKMDMARFS